jgi:two-component system, NtrC family, sensor histidine kinase PilS
VHTLRILRWVYLGRLTLAAGIFTGAVLVWLQGTVPKATLLATLALLSAVAVTGASAWWTHVLQRRPLRNFLYGQVLFDALLVTLVVHITGGAESSFPPLYILVIVAGSLLLPLPGGMLIGALSSLLYFADMVWWQDGEPAGTAVLQIGVFVLVAMATAALADRLRRTGTALGEAESELRQLRLDTNDILAAIDTGLITVDAAGRVAHMNGAAALHLGLHPSALEPGLPIDALEDAAPGLREVFDRTVATRQPVRRFEVRRRGAAGERVLSVRTTVLERAGLPWVTAVLQDVTEAREIEELIRRAERLQAVAELGASLAHEIRNPLASIRSAVEQLAGAPLSARDRDTLRHLVVDESDRLSRLLSEFMEFSRIELRRWTKLDLREVLSDALALLAQHPEAAGGTRIDYIAPLSAVEVEGDRDLLHRALFNLLLNAVQHSGASGFVHVALGRVGDLDIPSTVQMAAPVQVTVRDSGPGIPPDQRGRVFDPFFTTREGGTGLGLAMVHRAIEAHSGAILVNGDSGEGAEFTIYLPTPSARRT